jgi:hypothetical protein
VTIRRHTERSVECRLTPEMQRRKNRLLHQKIQPLRLHHLLQWTRNHWRRLLCRCC